MTPSVYLMQTTGDQQNVVGEPVRADSWYGYSDGMHTVSFHVTNFTGRIFIQATLEANPTEDDWFDICLGKNNPYLQFPLRPGQPTGLFNGDTSAVAMNFKANVLWLRAKVDRHYLPPLNPINGGTYGFVSKIILGR